MVRVHKPVQSKASRKAGRAGPKNVGGARPTKRKAPQGKLASVAAALTALFKKVDRPAYVIGGIAVIAHGYSRNTNDVDAAVVATVEEVPEIARIAKSLGFRLRTRDAVRFAQQNLVLLLEHKSSGFPVDLSLAHHSFEISAAERAVVRSIEGAAILVAPLDALLVYKMVAARPKDIDDVTGLLATRKPFDESGVLETLRELDALLDTDRAGELAQLLRARQAPSAR